MTTKEKQQKNREESLELMRQSGISTEQFGWLLTLSAFAVALAARSTKDAKELLVKAGVKAKTDDFKINELCRLSDIMTKDTLMPLRPMANEKFIADMDFYYQFMQLVVQIDDDIDRLKAVSTLKLFVKPSKK